MFETILCVDDDPITLMLCKKVIQKASFSKEVLFANNGQDAISILEKIKLDENNQKFPEIIFLDLNMPVANGWDFLDYFKNKDSHIFFKNTKVIILSSTIDPSDFSKSKQYEMVTHFLSKPINTDMLEKLRTELK